MTLVLLTGGVRSGKSAWAERLLAPDAPVTYVATGPERDDADWRTRVRAHQERRPAAWSTVATPDAATALRSTERPVLLDCLGTWTTATLDELHAWDEPRDRWGAAFDHRADDVREFAVHRITAVRTA